MDNNDRLLMLVKMLVAYLVLGYLVYKIISAFVFLIYKGISIVSNALYGPRPSRIEIITNVTQCNEFIDRIRKDCKEYCVLGFDIEYVYVKNYYGKQPVSLIQLCTHRGLCGLIRLQYMRGLPMELYRLLGDRSILKVGVCPNADAQLLSEHYNNYNMIVDGIFDLRHLAEKLPGYRGGSLQNLSETFLNIPRKDTSEITRSDWNSPELSPEQIEYAANVNLISILNSLRDY